MGIEARIASVEDAKHYRMEAKKMKAPETKAEDKKVAGVDVGKSNLDVSIARGKPLRFANTPDGMAQMLSWLREGGATLVAFESSGGYERRLASFLRNSKMPYHAAHALRVRNFARAAGYEAKTDGIDARVLSEYGEKFDLSPDAPEDAETEALRDILSRRKQLVDQRSAERNRRDKGAVRDARASVERHIKWLDKEIERLDRRYRKALSESAELSAKAELYASVPGVGELTAATLAAYLPELGAFDGKRLTALVGLAPWSRDSGAKRGYRSIRGGRGRVRQALYMAALSATRWNADLSEFYQRLLARGKRKMVALTAVMRKLLLTLNAIARRGSPWEANPSP